LVAVAEAQAEVEERAERSGLFCRRILELIAIADHAQRATEGAELLAARRALVAEGDRAEITEPLSAAEVDGISDRAAEAEVRAHGARLRAPDIAEIFGDALHHARREPVEPGRQRFVGGYGVRQAAFAVVESEIIEAAAGISEPVAE